MFSQPKQKRKTGTASVVCEPCRKSRRKCDRQRPCARCSLSSQTHLCKYPADSSLLSATFVIASNVSAVSCTQCCKFNSRCDRKRPGCSQCTKRGESCLYPREKQDLETSSSKAKAPVLIDKPHSESHHDGQMSPSYDLSSRMQELASFSQSNSVCEYLGPSSVMHSVRTFSNSSSGSPETFNSVRSDGTELQLRDGFFEASNIKIVESLLQEIFTALPSQQVSAHLLDYFASDQVPITKISFYYDDRFKPKLSQLWKEGPILNRESIVSLPDRQRLGILVDELHWLGYLCLKFATALTFLPATAEPECQKLAPHAEMYYRLGNSACSACNQVSQLVKSIRPPTFERLLVLVVSTLWLKNTEHANLAWEQTGQAVRLAITLGMHIKQNIDAQKAEDLGRVWWILLNMDRILSLLLGRPSAIDNSQFDVPVLLNLDDHCVEVPSNILTKNSLSIAGARLAVIAGEIQTRCFGLTGYNEGYSAVDELDRELHQFWSSLPSLVHEQADGSLSISHHLSLSAHFIVMIYYNELISLHRSYLFQAHYKLYLQKDLTLEEQNSMSTVCDMIVKYKGSFERCALAAMQLLDVHKRYVEKLLSDKHFSHRLKSFMIPLCLCDPAVTLCMALAIEPNNVSAAAWCQIVDEASYTLELLATKSISAVSCLSLVMVFKYIAQRALKRVKSLLSFKHLPRVEGSTIPTDLKKVTVDILGVSAKLNFQEENAISEELYGNVSSGSSATLSSLQISEDFDSMDWNDWDSLMRNLGFDGFGH